jgi:hypothetical protein
MVVEVSVGCVLGSQKLSATTLPYRSLHSTSRIMVVGIPDSKPPPPSSSQGCANTEVDNHIPTTRRVSRKDFDTCCVFMCVVYKAK